MTNENEKIARGKVLANALEVYIQLLRGMSADEAMRLRPFKGKIQYALDTEEEIACDLSIDRSIAYFEAKKSARPSSAKDEEMVISPRGVKHIIARQEACKHDWSADVSDQHFEKECRKCGLAKIKEAV